MARKSTRRVPQGRAHSSAPIHSLTAIKQQPISTAFSRKFRKQEYFKISQRRRLAFAAQREKRSRWVATAHDTMRIVLGDGKYSTHQISTRLPLSVPPSPFRYATLPMTIFDHQGNPLEKVVQSFYNIGPQIVISQQGTTFYPHCSPGLADWRGYRASSPRMSSTIRFVPQSTLAAARHLITDNSQYMKQHPNSLPTSTVGVLSFASAKRPGGGFLHGGDEQEETLARSTSLVTSLRSSAAKEFYLTHKKFQNTDGTGLHDHSMVYSPGVVAFRRDDDDCGTTVPPFLINVLSSVPVNAAAIRHNYLITSSDAPLFREGIRSTMRDRMARALRIFEIRGDHALVLGAFGCGSSEIDVEMVAELWAELLVCGSREGKEGTISAKFKGTFEEIVFAVSGKLFVPFKRAFEMRVLEMEVISAASESSSGGL